MNFMPRLGYNYCLLMVLNKMICVNTNYELRTIFSDTQELYGIFHKYVI